MGNKLRQIATNLVPPNLKSQFHRGLLKWRVVRRYPLLSANPAWATRYMLTGIELDNFTYDITSQSEIELAHFLSQSVNCSQNEVRFYLDEIKRDRPLRAQLNSNLRTRYNHRSRAYYGRRVGWYALVRLLKPSLIVETGVHNGLGSSLLLRALQQNAHEGHVGRLIGVDINTEAGWLVPESLRPWFTFIAQDSTTALPDIAAVNQIDLFIHDSDHTAEHETREYSLVSDALSSRAVILSDNAHSTHSLKDYSKEHNRTFSFWKEQPKLHFYPGAGIGLSVPIQLTSANSTY